MKPQAAVSSLILLSFFAGQTASARPVVLNRYVATKTSVSRDCLINGGSMTTETSGAFSCVVSSTGIATNCSASGNCSDVCIGKECGASAKKPTTTATTGGPTNGGSGGTKPSPLPPRSAPPAGGPGSITPAPSSGGVPGPIIRDHRPGGNSAGASGGVTTVVHRR